MGALNLVPLVILSLVLGGIGWVLYQVCLSFPLLSSVSTALALALALSRAIHC
jgi:hypothetical protein